MPFPHWKFGGSLVEPAARVKATRDMNQLGKQS
jgi:hypothetical protein